MGGGLLTVCVRPTQPFEVAVAAGVPQPPQTGHMPQKVAPAAPCRAARPVHHAGLARANQSAAGKANAQTQIDIFAIHMVAGIEAAEPLEQRARKEQKGGVDPIGRTACDFMVR